MLGKRLKNDFYTFNKELPLFLREKPCRMPARLCFIVFFEAEVGIRVWLWSRGRGVLYREQSIRKGSSADIRWGINFSSMPAKKPKETSSLLAGWSFISGLPSSSWFVCLSQHPMPPGQGIAARRAALYLRAQNYGMQLPVLANVPP